MSRSYWAKVQITPGCWLWNGAVTSAGYGNLRTPDGNVSAHRFGYELRHGPVPDGLVLDHLCRVKTCVNPAHLEPVTQRVNTLRGTSPAAARAAQTACHLGHLLSGDNLYVKPNGGRDCRACRAISDARRSRSVSA